jgi:PAS domain S-box-containing protein
VDSVRDHAIFLLDPGGLVRSWNTGAEAILGYRADDILGHHLGVLFSTADRAPASPMPNWCRRGRTAHRGGRLARAQGRHRFWAKVVITAVYGRTGDLVGFAKVTQDLTQRRKVEDLERSSGA